MAVGICCVWWPAWIISAIGVGTSWFVPDRSQEDLKMSESRTEGKNKVGVKGQDSGKDGTPGDSRTAKRGVDSITNSKKETDAGIRARTSNRGAEKVG